MRYVIYGAGAVGGVIGAQLARHGHEVALIARGAHLAAIRDDGLTLVTPEGRETVTVNAFAGPTEAMVSAADTVLLTMKTQDTDAALVDLLAAAGPEVPVICAQNGVENERLALRRFHNVYGMLVILPGTFLEPGVVETASAPLSGALDIGRYPSGSDPLAANVATVLRDSAFSSTVRPEIMRWKYGKLLSNVGNVIQAAFGTEIDTASLGVPARNEALACYEAAGISAATAEEMREAHNPVFGDTPLRTGPRHGGSTWQSVVRGGSVETDFLNGEIGLLGRLHGVPTPVNDYLSAIGAYLGRGDVEAGSLRIEGALQALGLPG